jgi:hypothetical protein
MGSSGSNNLILNQRKMVLKCSPNPRSWHGSSDLKGCFWEKSVYQVLLKTKNHMRSCYCKSKTCGIPPIQDSYLVVRTREILWTTDRLEKRGQPHNDKCVLCNFDVENALHLTTGRVTITIIWSNILNWNFFKKNHEFGN